MLGVRVSLAPVGAPGRRTDAQRGTAQIEISAVEIIKQSSIQSDLKHQETNKGGFELLMQRKDRAESLENRI